MIIITGGHGFLGSHLVKQLGDREMFIPHSFDYGLRWKDDTMRLVGH
jgi:nucleoside-diphosphate-sugar epimerase